MEAGSLRESANLRNLAKPWADQL